MFVVTPPICGENRIWDASSGGNVTSGLSAATGSGATVSSAAPLSFPLASARTSASLSTISPRAVFTR